MPSERPLMTEGEVVYQMGRLTHQFLWAQWGNQGFWCPEETHIVIASTHLMHEIWNSVFTRFGLRLIRTGWDYSLGRQRWCFYGNWRKVGGVTRMLDTPWLQTTDRKVTDFFKNKIEVCRKIASLLLHNSFSLRNA